MIFAKAAAEAIRLILCAQALGFVLRSFLRWFDLEDTRFIKILDITCEFWVYPVRRVLKKFTYRYPFSFDMPFVIAATAVFTAASLLPRF